MIPFTDDAGLRDYRAPVTRAPRRTWARWLVLLACLLGLAVTMLGCRHVPPVVALIVVPDTPRHEIGAWLDDDEVCVAVRTPYRARMCLPMRAIRTLILSARDTEDGGP